MPFAEDRLDPITDLKRLYGNFKAAFKGEVPPANADDPVGLIAHVVGHRRQKDNFAARESMRQIIEACRARGDEATAKKSEFLGYTTTVPSLLA